MTFATFEPRWASPPGESILNALRSLGWSAEELADVIGLSDPDTRRLLLGELPVDPDIAASLAEFLGGTQDFWLQRERAYRTDLGWVEADELANAVPLRQMASFGWVQPTHSWRGAAEACLEFFGVSSASEWNARFGKVIRDANYRTSPTFPSTGPAVAAWLRQADKEAAVRVVNSWDPSALRALLPALRQLTRQGDPLEFKPTLERLLGDVGVALVLVRAPEGCAASGAAYSDGARRVIVLSARHLSDDHLFFTLFHEIGHLLLHGEGELFVDEFDDAGSNAMEASADEFAQHALIPRDLEGLSASRTSGPSMREVLAFAAQCGVAPGVVVGQLQHVGRLRFNQLNGLKRRYRWSGTSLKSARK